ncbi:unnamed protein product [Prorocentrum cordatum]|uniref:Uncharacterized protein n=1 Tax=Prorocentrum cordatum TaxID=2364126 RepID=A0ABN9QWJ5_9DINO|nr:unnamed protein product [Polarella glacialis]
MTAGTAQIRRPRSAGHQSTRACGTVVLQESSGGRHRQSFSREGGAAGPDVPPGVGCFRAKTALAPPENCAHKPLARACASTVRPSQENSSAGEPTGREAHAPHVPGEDIRGRRRGHALGAGGGGNRRARQIAVTANEEKGEEGGVERRHRARRGPRRHLPRALAKKKRSSRARPSGAQREGGGKPGLRGQAPLAGRQRVLRAGRPCSCFLTSASTFPRDDEGGLAPPRSRGEASVGSRARALLRARAPCSGGKRRARPVSTAPSARPAARPREPPACTFVYSWRARAGLVCAKQEARKHRGTKLRSFSLRD